MIESQLSTIATAPVIYAFILPISILPISMLDIFVAEYQSICFSVYAIVKVRRCECIVIDRYSLAYLNVIEKLNCVCCDYCNGVLAYAREWLNPCRLRRSGLVALD